MGEASAPGWKRLSFAAWLALAAHLIAGLAMALILRQGLSTNANLASRLAFVGRRSCLWTAGWLTWNAAALSILYFFFAAAVAFDGEAALGLAVAIAAAGVALDLSAEAIEMGALPELARRGLTELFLTVDRLAVLMTGYAANGLYSIATLLFWWTTRRRYPRWIAVAGLGVGLSGAALSWAALAGSVPGMFWTNAALVPCVLAWQAGIALDASRRGGPDPGRGGG